MPMLAFPWLTLLVAVPGLGALIAFRLDPDNARRFALGVSLSAVLISLGALMAVPAGGALADPLDPFAAFGKSPWFVLDELSAPLLPFGALLFVVAALAAPRKGERRGQSARLLAAETVTLATFACQSEIGLGVLWLVGLLPIDAELSAANAERGRSIRLYMLASVLLVAVGLALRSSNHASSALSSALLLAGVMVRKGIAPLHSWMPALFERAPLHAAVLFSTPQIGTYVAVRLIAPVAPVEVLSVLGTASLVTAVYAAALALAQDDGRRAFGWLFMSQSALVLAGVECTSVTGLAGGLSLWISSSLSLAGFGMTLAVLEARRGHVSLRTFCGGYESTPMLAASFLLLGLCTVGFPGTLGFVGAELLLDGSVQAHPQVGIAVVIASVLNGITVVRMFFVLFCGARRTIRPELRLRTREHAAFALLVAALVLGGLIPQPLLDGRGRAAARTLDSRRHLGW